jgi:hypothetical protein
MLSGPNNGYVECKMRLDTGLEQHDLISRQLVDELSVSNAIIIKPMSICVCLNGQELMSSGTINIRWKGKSFRKVFTTKFYVIDRDLLPWEVILGAATINEHKILKFAGFGGRAILPKKGKGGFMTLLCWF